MTFVRLNSIGSTPLVNLAQCDPVSYVDVLRWWNMEVLEMLSLYEVVLEIELNRFKSYVEAAQTWLQNESIRLEAEFTSKAQTLSEVEAHEAYGWYMGD